MGKSKKRTLTKLEIYEELGSVIAMLDKKRPDKAGALERLRALRSGMLSDIVSSERKDADGLRDRKAIMDILEGKPMHHAQPVHATPDAKGPEVYVSGGRFVYMHSHMLVIGRKNVTDLSPKELPESLKKAVEAITGEDYRAPGTESFACPDLKTIEFGIKSAGGRTCPLVNDEIVYRFERGLSMKATYLMWAVMLSGAEKAYAKTGTCGGRKAYNKIAYFPGEDFDVYVCPVTSTEGREPGFYSWRDAF